MPVVTDGGKSLLDCEAVLPLMAMLGCIAHPTNRRWFVDLAASPAMAYDDGALDATLRAWSDDRDGWDALIAHAPTPRLTSIEAWPASLDEGRCSGVSRPFSMGASPRQPPESDAQSECRGLRRSVQTMVGPHGEDGYCTRRSKNFAGSEVPPSARHLLRRRGRYAS